MFQIYKNYFYIDRTAFKDIYPPTIIQSDQFLPIQPTTEVEQIRFGCDYLCSKPQQNLEIDITIPLLTATQINVKKKSFQTDRSIMVWLTMKLPNNRHIDWIFKSNSIRLEYYIEGYGYTNYLFQEIYKGKSDDKLITKDYQINDSNQLWIYDSTSNRKRQKTQIITNEAPELMAIITQSNQLIRQLQQSKFNTEASTKEVYELINNLKTDKLFDDLINLVIDFDLVNHPVFPLIHQLQCYVHDVDDMFKLAKLWEKTVKPIEKTDSIKVSQIQKQKSN